MSSPSIAESVEGALQGVKGQEGPGRKTKREQAWGCWEVDLASCRQGACVGRGGGECHWAARRDSMSWENLQVKLGKDCGLALEGAVHLDHC